MPHALVIRRNKEIDKLYISPSNDLPDGESYWDACLGSICGLESILSDDYFLNNTCDCCLLPLERLPLDYFNGPL